MTAGLDKLFQYGKDLMNFGHEADNGREITRFFVLEGRREEFDNSEHAEKGGVKVEE